MWLALLFHLPYLDQTLLIDYSTSFPLSLDIFFKSLTRQCSKQTIPINQRSCTS